MSFCGNNGFFWPATVPIWMFYIHGRYSKCEESSTTIKFEHMGSRVKFEWLPRINVSSTLVQHAFSAKKKSCHTHFLKKYRFQQANIFFLPKSLLNLIIESEDLWPPSSKCLFFKFTKTLSSFQSLCMMLKTWIFRAEVVSFRR